MTSKVADFESALHKLGEIVKLIDAGDLSLEEAIKQYEDGVQLIKICQEFLKKAEQKVEILAKDLESSINTGSSPNA